MKLLRVINSMDPAMGGPPQGIRNSIPELEKLGVINHVVCNDDPKAEFLKELNFKVFPMGVPKGPWRFNRKLREWLKSNIENYDVVIVHGLWLHHEFSAFQEWKKLKSEKGIKTKLFLMPHGMLDPYFQKSNERRLKALRNEIYWKLIEKNIVNNCSGILFTCQEELLLARTTFRGYKPEKELNVGYGIPEPPAYSNEMAQSFKAHVPLWDGKPFLLFLSRIHSKKGLDNLIKSYLKIEASRDDLPQLLIAGPGHDTAYGKDMLKLASKSTNIIFTGMLSGDIKWGAFHLCETFVLPSHQENFGISIVEALACKKPVLISNKVNIWREIENGNGGFVEVDNEKGTHTLLIKWLSLSEPKKIEMSEGAYKSYMQIFAVENAAERMLSLISPK